jgi:hypothetical protein
MELPCRHSIRKKGWDCTSPARYFVTLNTRDGRPLFGAIINGRMVIGHLNPDGMLACILSEASPELEVCYL